MKRIPELDALRGLALVGIVLVNVQWFSGHAVHPDPAHDRWGLDGLTTFGLHALVDGKFYTLFALLFGASFALVLARSGSRVAQRRLLSLGLLGSLHATLLWFGDILSLYAVAAIPLARLLRSPHALRWALGLLVSPALLGGVLLLWPTDTASGGHGPTMLLPAFGGDDLAALLQANLAFLRQRWVLAFASGRLPRLLGTFLLGAWLLHHRPRPSTGQRRVLVAVALLSNLALAGLADTAVFPPSARAWASGALSCIALPSGALAYLALLLPWLRRRGRVVRALEHAGRLSLTHYLTQSLVLAAVFYGVGLDGWSRLGATEGAVVGLLLVAGQIAMSGPLLRRLQVGPAERLLRAMDRPRSGGPRPPLSGRRRPSRPA